MPVTLPAGPHHELGLDPGRVQRVVLRHGEGLVGNSVHIERDPWDFHVEDVVVPLLVADLRERGRVSAGVSTSHSSRLRGSPAPRRTVPPGGGGRRVRLY